MFKQFAFLAFASTASAVKIGATDPPTPGMETFTPINTPVTTGSFSGVAEGEPFPSDYAGTSEVFDGTPFLVAGLPEDAPEVLGPTA